MLVLLFVFACVSSQYFYDGTQPQDFHNQDYIKRDIGSVGSDFYDYQWTPFNPEGNYGGRDYEYRGLDYQWPPIIGGRPQPDRGNPPPIDPYPYRRNIQRQRYGRFNYGAPVLKIVNRPPPQNYPQDPSISQDRTPGLWINHGTAER